MRSYAVLAACLLILTSCSKSEPVAEKLVKGDKSEKSDSTEPLKKYELIGEVARLDPDAQLATIKHHAIGDWMGPMTMEFPVKDPADFAKLAPGKPVSATVFVQGLHYWVADVKDMPAPPPNTSPK